MADFPVKIVLFYKIEIILNFLILAGHKAYWTFIGHKQAKYKQIKKKNFPQKTVLIFFFYIIARGVNLYTRFPSE